jgi:hypothetical protein
MASVDKDTLNGVAKTTDVHAGAQPTNALFNGAYVFGADAFPAFAFKSAMSGQDIDGAYGRAMNAGRGVVGEGAEVGPGVVGIAGDVIANPGKPFPRLLWNPPFPGRGWRVGVVGFGADPGARGERGGKNDAVGVLGHAEQSVGVWGRSTALPGVLGTASRHAGVYGAGSTGVIGDGSGGWNGVEGISGAQWGVYGHVNYKSPNADMIGVVGAAALDLGHPENTVGRAALFMGPVDVDGNLTVWYDMVVFGTKSAAARHTDGTHRLLYCVESPESQFEDFGEARLVKGRAQVRLDRDFVGVADTRRYHVFVTPYGDSNGLYIAKRSRDGFEVREQGGGTSSIGFSYRVVAKRKGVSTKRFQKITRPKRPKIPAALVRPEIDPTALKTSVQRSARKKRSKK